MTVVLGISIFNSFGVNSGKWWCGHEVFDEFSTAHHF